MKLFEASVWNGYVGGDKEIDTFLFVCGDLKKAKKNAVKIARSRNSCFCDPGEKKDKDLLLSIEEVIEVDGYQVLLKEV